MSNVTIKKRKSDASSSVPTKKTRTRQVDASDLVSSILDDAENFSIPDDDKTILDYLTRLARYARSLEDNIEEMKPKEKTSEEIDEAAEKLRTAAVSGIKKQMSWKPSCKTGSSKWAYDGVCPDPAVFAALLGLEMPLKFKLKKIPIGEFEDALGPIHGHARYNTLYLRGDHVNVHWKPEDGTFKFSGSYGA